MKLLPDSVQKAIQARTQKYAGANSNFGLKIQTPAAFAPLKKNRGSSPRLL
jgi:hypothetical protein